MKTARTLTYTLIASWFLATSSMADKLPKSAKPLTAEEITAMYAGHTAKWKGSNAWFAPDKSIKGLFGKKLDEALYFGTWSVTGNEVCMTNNSEDVKTKKKGGPFTDCWQWFRDDKKRLWTLWSKHYDGSKVPKNAYYRGEEKILVEGDSVSEKFDKLKAM
jgi:hypothetical protein